MGGCRDEETGQGAVYRVYLDRDGYDSRGQYWGVGEKLYAIVTDRYWDHVRASCRGAARLAALEMFPNVKFRRHGADFND